MNETPGPLISVVVPFRNGRATLLHLLFSLLLQRYPKERYEIILINDASTDDSVEIAALVADEFRAKGYSISMVNSKEWVGAARARNLGIRASSGEKIAFADQDVIVDRDWLQSIVVNMNDEWVGGVYGRIVTDFKNFIEPLNCTAVTQKYLTCNVAYKKRLLLEYGGFDESYPFHRGDSELAYRLIEKNYDLKNVEGMIVYHPLKRMKLRDLVGVARWTQYDILLHKQHPTLTSADAIPTLLPHLTPEGGAFIGYLAYLIALFVLVPQAFVFIWALLPLAMGVLSLAALRPLYRGKSLVVRLAAAGLTVLNAGATIIGRLVGAVRFRHIFI